MSSSKNGPVKGLCGRCYLSVTRTPYPPPLAHCICVYSDTLQFTYSHRGEGGELNQREGERGNSSQGWVENTNMTDCISML
jgi:hypothetical protein